LIALDEAMMKPPATQSRTSLRHRIAGPFTVIILLAGVVSLIAWIELRPENLSRHEAAVREIEAAPERRAEFEKEFYCHIEPGPPLRVAFVQPGSLLDNWTGIVYDPTGEVLKANEIKRDGSNLSEPGFRQVRELFGGDLIWAEPLGAHWYRCGFT
jgi:hypothetical protein